MKPLFSSASHIKLHKNDYKKMHSSKYNIKKIKEEKASEVN
jgi:hypothetical protein